MLLYNATQRHIVLELSTETSYLDPISKAAVKPDPSGSAACFLTSHLP